MYNLHKYLNLGDVEKQENYSGTVTVYRQFLLLILLHTTYSELDLDKALLSGTFAWRTGSTLPIAVGFVAIPLGSWRRGAFPPRNFSWATSL